MCDKKCNSCSCKPDANFRPKTSGLRFEYNETPVVKNTNVSDYSKEKQVEWAAVNPFDKNANKGLATLAPQRTQSAFKGAVRGGW